MKSIMNLKQLSGLESADMSAKSVADKVRTGDFAEIITLTELYTKLTTEESKLVEWILSLRPSDVGVNTPFYGLDEPDADTKFHVNSYDRSISKKDGTIKTYTVTNYTPVHVWNDWKKMADELVAQGFRSFDLLSGYRSTAYQCTLLCYRLSHNLDTPLEVFKQLALPGYSQHGLIKDTAIDIDVTYVDEWEWEKFANTEEFTWLTENASLYNFKLSYPENNPDGIAFEPWHWQWCEKAD